MGLTSIFSNVFLPRQKALQKHINGGVELQSVVLRSLIERAKSTEYGRNHMFGAIEDYDAFAKSVPLNSYEELKEDIDRMRHGEANILWPGTVKNYAKSSGTTNDKSKFIPITYDGLHHIHYKGPYDVVAFYLRKIGRAHV